MSIEFSRLLSATEVIDITFPCKDEIRNRLEILEFRNALLVSLTLCNCIFLGIIVGLCLVQLHGGTFDGVSGFVTKSDLHLRLDDLEAHQGYRKAYQGDRYKSHF